MRFLYQLTFLGLSSIFCGSLHAQGPIDGYMKGKGVVDIAPSFSFNNARRFEGANGAIFDEIYRGQMLSLFATYGLTKRLDLVATAAMVFTPTQSGLQDGGVFVKFRPFYRTLGSAGNLGVIGSSGLTFPMSDYEPTASGALGQKAVTWPFKMVVQWDTPLGLFFNLTGAYHARLDRLNPQDIALVQQQRPDYEPIQPPNFSTLLIKAGFPAKHYYLDAWVEWQNTRGGSDYVPNVPDLAQAFGVSYTQVGGVIYYSDTGRNGFYISGASMLGGRNISRIQRITLGMVFKW